MIRREPGVIESGAGPRCGRVARRTRRWEACRRVIRIGRTGVVGFMARVAIHRRACVHTTDVAETASDGRVCARERERRVVMVERRVEPRSRRVAHRAVLRIAGRHVIGDTSHARCGVVVFGMAAVTIRRKRSRVVVRVAGCAGDRRVCARERK